MNDKHVVKIEKIDNLQFFFMNTRKKIHLFFLVISVYEKLQFISWGKNFLIL